MAASQLRVESYRMSAAGCGRKNPLPELSPPAALSNKPKKIHESVPEEDRKYLGYGWPVGRLPHRMQFGYDRDRRPRDFKVAVLENDFLRATFLLELGGRLWSLIHKPSGRELLDVNPVFQPVNIGFRNVWFSGGVEWNGPVPGHGPRTCSPLFAARVEGEDGEPVLRLYEWDRIRGIPYQLDFRLPAGACALLVHVRLVNPSDREVPCWWWSNIAVAERRDVRVLVPAETALVHRYEEGLARVPIPLLDGKDVSYSTNHDSAYDYFYYIPDGTRPWIAALDGEGRGLVQTSTSRLKGRKLFLWGMSRGGRRSQEWLSVDGHAYIEIQAGLARTQGECLPMPPRAEWSWLEAYTLMEAPPEVVHGSDWRTAWREVDRRLEETFPRETMESEYARAREASRRRVKEVLHRGSGWGALELRRRSRAGEEPFCSGEMVFDDASMDEDQAPWLSLLEDGALPRKSVAEYPGAWMVQREWREILEDGLRSGRGDHWLAWLHLGVMLYHAGETERAKQAWRTSLERERSGWALRNLAVAALHEERKSQGARLLLEASEMLPELAPLALECAKALIDSDQPGRAAQYIDGLTGELRRHSRMPFHRAAAALKMGDFETVERILKSASGLTDVREGERSFVKLWLEMWEKRVAAEENIPIDDELRRRVRRDFPPPWAIDFRMAPDELEK